MKEYILTYSIYIYEYIHIYIYIWGLCRDMCIYIHIYIYMRVMIIGHNSLITTTWSGSAEPQAHPPLPATACSRYVIPRL